MLARRRLVCLVLRWVLLWLQTLVIGAVVLFYPALGVITPLGAHPSEWGPIILVLVRVRRILLRVALELSVFWGHLWLFVLLEEGVEVVLVVLV